MNDNFPKKRLDKQRGFALLMLVFVLTIAGLAGLLNYLNGTSVKIERDKKTVAALAEAKAALIGWSASQTTLSKLGQLPCPEDTSKIGTLYEGDAKSSCTLPAIGRLPWRTLGLAGVTDGNNERLWYVVSPGFRGVNINSDTPAQLTVDGNLNSAVAIIFSAGTPLNGQRRPEITSSTPPDKKQYLDLLNNTGVTSFISFGPLASFNDKLMVVYHQDLFLAVENRVAKEVLRCLDVYSESPVAADADGNPISPPPSGTYPWPSLLNLNVSNAPPSYDGVQNNFFGRVPDYPMGGKWSGACSIPIGGGGWWTNWKELVFFALSEGYKPTSEIQGCGECLAVLPNDSADKKIVVMVAGKKLNGQIRSSNSDKGNLSNYLEGFNSISMTRIFVKKSGTNTYNDVVFYE